LSFTRVYSATEFSASYILHIFFFFFFFFQAEDGIRDLYVTGVQTCALPILLPEGREVDALREVLPQQAVGVFVGATLPRALRIAEVDLDLGGHGKSLVGEIGRASCRERV